MPLSDPFSIYVGGMELLGWTEATLSRHKQEMTGELSVAVFRGELPNAPILAAAKAGAEVMAFIAGFLVFRGEIDSRKGGGKSKSGSSAAKTAGAGRARSIGSGHQAGGGGLNTSITPNAYLVTLRAKGKTQHLMKSSHDHKTGTILNATTRKVMQEAVKSHRVQLEWLAPEFDMDKFRFQDGGIIDDEIQRVAQDYGYHTYETREGRLRITDGTGGMVGEPLILGDNITEFSAEQGNVNQQSQIKTKGHRTKKGMRGEEAVKRQRTHRTGGNTAKYSPLTLQFYGDATDEALDRRARFEADKRNQEDKIVRVDVFHVQTRTGQPWDIGSTHLVVVPPEGIFDEMECVGLVHTVSHDRRIKTQLTLAPLPGAGNGTGGLSAIVSMLSGGAGIGAIAGGITAVLNGSFPGLAAIGGAGGLQQILSGAGAIGGLLGRTDAQALGDKYRAELGIEADEEGYPESWDRTETESAGDEEGDFEVPPDVEQGVAEPEFDASSVMD